jgi:hypothetical protein
MILRVNRRAGAMDVSFVEGIDRSQSSLFPAELERVAHGECSELLGAAGEE